MNQDLTETVMSPSKKNLFNRKRSEHDDIGRDRNLSFQHTLPELKTKISIGQYTPYKSVTIDPAHNFVNPTRKHLKFNNSDKLGLSQSIKSRVQEEAGESNIGDEVSESQEGPIMFTKKLINAQSTVFNEVKPKYQLSRRTFGIGYSMSPNQFAATTSRMSLNPSNNPNMMNNYYLVAKEHNLKIDNVELQAEDNFNAAFGLVAQKNVMQGLQEFYHQFMITIAGQMTASNSAQIAEHAQLVKRIQKASHSTIMRIKSLTSKELELIRGVQQRAEIAKDKMMAELQDFKQNRTIEAYFARFQKIPNLEDRKKLITMIDLYLVDDKQLPNQQIYGIKSESAGADMILEGLEEPAKTNFDLDQPSLEAMERKMYLTLKEVKNVMLTEAEGVRRLTEKNIRDKLLLNGGKCLTKNKGTETETWTVIQERFQKQIDSQIQMNKQLEQTLETTQINQTKMSESRIKEIYTLKAQVEVLEAYKQRTNIQNVLKQLSDNLFNLLESKLDGIQATEIMIQFQEQLKAIDKNQQLALNRARKPTDNSLSDKMKMGLLKKAVVVKSDTSEQLTAPINVIQTLTTATTPTTTTTIATAMVERSNQFSYLPKADSAQLQVIDAAIIEIKQILQETDDLVNLMVSKREICGSLEVQFEQFIESQTIVVQNLPENLKLIASACEQSKNTKMATETLPQVLALVDKMKEIQGSQDFKQANRFLIQLRQLALIRQLVEQVNQKKEEEKAAYAGNYIEKQDAFMSDIVQTLCQILTTKEKLSMLPNPTKIKLIIQTMQQVKEIGDLIGKLLAHPKSNKRLSEATNDVIDYKKAFGEIKTLSTQIQKLLPKTIEWDKVQASTTSIIQDAIVASMKMKAIDQLNKNRELLKIVTQAQEVIKSHEKPEVKETTPSKRNQLNKVEEEDSQKFDSDADEAVIVLELKSQKTPAKAPQKGGKAPTKTSPLVRPPAAGPIFTNEDLDAAIEKNVKTKVQEAVDDLAKKYEEEKNALIAQHQITVVNLQRQLATGTDSEPCQKRHVESAQNVDADKNSPSQLKQNNTKQTTEPEETLTLKQKGKKKLEITAAKQQKVKVVAANVEKAKVTVAVKEQPQKPKVAHPQPTNPSPSNQKSVNQTSTPKKEIKSIEVVKRDSSQSIDKTNSQLVHREVVYSNQRNRQQKMQPIIEENQKSPNGGITMIIDDNNSIQTVNRSKHTETGNQSKHTDSPRKSTVGPVSSIEEQNNEDASPEFHIKDLNQNPKQQTASRKGSFVKKIDADNQKSHQNIIKSNENLKTDIDQSWIDQDRDPNQTQKTVFSDKPKQIIQIIQEYSPNGEILFQNNEQELQDRRVIEIIQEFDLNQNGNEIQKLESQYKHPIETPPEVEHLEQPRLTTQHPEMTETNTAEIQKRKQKAIMMKTQQRELMKEKPEYGAIVNFTNSNKTPLKGLVEEVNEDYYKSTIYDRESQGTLIEELNQAQEQEINMNQTNRTNYGFQIPKLTKRDSQSTVDGYLDPKLHLDLMPRKAYKEVNPDLTVVDSNAFLPIQIPKPFRVTKRTSFQETEDQSLQTAAHPGDSLAEFLTLLSQAFDQLMTALPDDPTIQKSILSRVAHFTEQLLGIEKEVERKSSMTNEIKASEMKMQEELTAGRLQEKSRSPRKLPGVNQFQQPGTYQMELSNNAKKPRVTVKNVGRIGGGFMGHAAK